jgi:hypothetical protein
VPREHGVSIPELRLVELMSASVGTHGSGSAKKLTPVAWGDEIFNSKVRGTLKLVGQIGVRGGLRASTEDAGVDDRLKLAGQTSAEVTR